MNELEQLQASLERATADHIRCIKLINDRLHAEAEDRNWCSQFDVFIEEANDGLNVKLSPRDHDWEVHTVLTIWMSTNYRGPTATQAIDAQIATLEGIDNQLARVLTGWQLDQVHVDLSRTSAKQV